MHVFRSKIYIFVCTTRVCTFSTISFFGHSKISFLKISTRVRQHANSQLQYVSEQAKNECQLTIKSLKWKKKPCNIFNPTPPPFQTSTKNSDSYPSYPFAHYDCVVLPPHIYRHGFQVVVRIDPPPTPTGLLPCVDVATVPANFYFLTFAILRKCPRT